MRKKNLINDFINCVGDKKKLFTYTHHAIYMIKKDFNSYNISKQNYHPLLKLAVSTPPLFMHRYEKRDLTHHLASS